MPDTEIEFVQLLQDMLGDLEGAPTPIEIKIFGDDQAQLEAISEEIEGRLADKHEIAGVVDVIGVERGGPEVTWQVDPLAAARVGPDGRTGRRSTVGGVARRQKRRELRLLDRTIPVRVRYPDAFRFNGTKLQQTMMRGANGKLDAGVGAGDGDRAGAAGRAAGARTSGRWRSSPAGSKDRDLGSAVADIQKMMDGMHAADRLHVGSRRPVPVAAHRVPAAAAWSPRIATRAGLRHPRRAVPQVHAGRPDSAGGAAVARRRVRAAPR